MKLISKQPISKQIIIYWSFLLPNLFGVLYFSLIPMMQVLFRSFQSAIGGRWVGIQNYVTVMGNAAFQRAIANTGKFTAVCIPLLIVISLALAVLLYSIPAVGSALRSIFLMPMAVPAASVVLVWKALFPKKGLINGALLALGGSGVTESITAQYFTVIPGEGSYVITVTAAGEEEAAALNALVETMTVEK
jgi:multiple sugar transport system permease protein